MNRRLVIGATIAFCGAIALGRVLFGTGADLQNSPVQAHQEASPSSDGSSLMAVANASATLTNNNIAQSAEVVSSPEIEQAKATSRVMREQRTGNRDLFPVDGGFRNENSRFSHLFSTQSLEGTLHTTQGGRKNSVRWLPQTQQLRRGHEVAAILTTAQGQLGKVEKAGDFSRMVYSGTYKNTDERMYVKPDGGVEHDYVLKQPVQGVDNIHDLAYTGYLQLGPGLSLWEFDTNKKITDKYVTHQAVKIKDRSGNTVFLLQPPVAYDANVTRADGTLDSEKQGRGSFCNNLVALEYQFDFDESGVHLAVVTPGKWLCDAGRAFPVIIDPNLGPFGLADGVPPLYVGTAGSDTVIPVYSGGKKLIVSVLCPNKIDNGEGHIPIPFDFTYYGILFPKNSILFTHIDGFASWLWPDPDEVPPFLPDGYPGVCLDHYNLPIPNVGVTPEIPNPPNGNIGKGRDHPYTMFPYWTDLELGSGPTATDPGSGIYYLTDGVAPNRRLIIEWHKMKRKKSQSIISFNLILSECDNSIEVIINANDKEVDDGYASVGIEGPSGVGIQYAYDDYWSAQYGSPPVPFVPLSTGTSIYFHPASIGQVSISPTTAAGCLPLEVCFKTTVIPLPVTCGTGPAVTPSLQFHWVFDADRYVAPGANNLPDARLDKGEAFTKDVCHTFVTAGLYRCSLTVTDEFGSQVVVSAVVNVCRIPGVEISVSPQGGFAPLEVTMEALTPTDPNLSLSGTANWNIERLGSNLEPGSNTPVATLTGNIVYYTFAIGGIYRVSSTFSGVDQATGIPVSGVGTAFVFVADQTDTPQDGIIITDSQIGIDWKSKVPPPAKGTITTSPLNPNKDTISMKGVINLLGVSQSDLAGHRVSIILNGVYPIFDGILDGSGNAVQGDQSLGNAGKFSISEPSGKFSCSTKGNLYGNLALNNLTESRLLPVHYQIAIDGLFQSPVLGPIVTYDYSSQVYKSAKGSYKFGMYSKQGIIIAQGPPPTAQNPNPRSGFPVGYGKNIGQTILVSGVFMATDVALKLEGSSVSATMKGSMSRFGGDGVLPAADSDVIVSIGGYTEALNFSTAPTFKTSGKAPFQKFSFKRGSSLGVAGVTALQWTNGAGDFVITAKGLPNEKVGINPDLNMQTLTVGLTITPENGQVFQGTARYSLVKKSPTDYVRSPK